MSTKLIKTIAVRTIIRKKSKNSNQITKKRKRQIKIEAN